MTAFVFTQERAQKIAKVLQAPILERETHFRIELKPKENNLQLNIELFSDIEIGDKKGNLVTVYTNYGVNQLHFCTAYVASDLLGEVTFISETEFHVSAIVVEREGGCTFYSNIDKSLLNKDFTGLGPEVMMTGVTLSIIEPLLNGGSVEDIENELE
jgi:hypothetical protein